MASTIWKGYITFGLISIPVRLFAAARSERISFNQIHEPCQSRIKQQIWCPTCERVVERSELVKGYEAEKDTYIIVEDEELKKIAPQSQETMEILEFVKLDEVDPLYFDASYYLTPEDPGRRAYHLLLETMQKTGFAAMAKLAMHQREYTVIIRPREEGLTLHTIYYANEVRAIPEYGTTKGIEVKPQEIQLAEQLVRSLATTFDPERFEDTYQKRLMEMLKAKREGRTVRETKTKKLAPVIDLMAALQRSLNQKAADAAAASSEDEDDGKKPARRATASGSSSERAAPKRRRAAG
jgi:DNA end-binding protein Ku